MQLPSASSPPPRRILSIWCARIALDRWRVAQDCKPGEGADSEPVALITETAHGPRIDTANAAGMAGGARGGHDVGRCPHAVPGLARCTRRSGRRPRIARKTGGMVTPLGPLVGARPAGQPAGRRHRSRPFVRRRGQAAGRCARLLRPARSGRPACYRAHGRGGMGPVTLRAPRSGAGRLYSVARRRHSSPACRSACGGAQAG